MQILLNERYCRAKLIIGVGFKDAGITNSYIIITKRLLNKWWFIVRLYNNEISLCPGFVNTY